jgi:hypothetical protein
MSEQYSMDLNRQEYEVCSYTRTNRSHFLLISEEHRHKLHHSGNAMSKLFLAYNYNERHSEHVYITMPGPVGTHLHISHPSSSWRLRPF